MGLLTGPCDIDDTIFMPPTKNLRQARKGLKHGAYSSPDVLRVPARYDGIYQQFLAEDKPFDLRRELALLRVLHCRMEDALAGRGEQVVSEIEETIADRVRKQFEKKTKDPERVAKVIDTLTQIAVSVIHEKMLMSSLGIGLDDLADHVEKISRVAERMKKIQEGVKLQVQIDTNLLVRFIQDVVFHFVADTATRQQIIQRAMMLSVGNRPADTALAAPRAAVTAENVNPLGSELAAESVILEQTEIPLEEML